VSDEMSEEKPTYKVTDRRPFNPDGTPREGVEREEPVDAAHESTGTQATPQAAATAGDDAPRAKKRTTSAPHAEERTTPAPPSGEDAELPGKSHDESAAGADVDPTPFVSLVMFVASPAAAALGLTEHPGISPGEVDLPLAKHCIDLLATLHERTRGNLGAQEQQILENVLTELRMQYVSLTSTRPSTPRGFTGKDITGGR
jgi:hypothetical protein